MIAPQLYLTPFLGQTDCSRVQMTSKQITQCLCSNCDRPYVLGENFQYMFVNTVSDTKLARGNSKEGIRIARDDGQVLYVGQECIVYYYKNAGQILIDHIPPVKRTAGKFAANRRFVLQEGTEFSSGDLLWEYSGFLRGVPAFGYNVFSAFIPFFGFNYEDAVVISESVADRAEVEMVETILVPITPKCIFKPVHPDSSLDGLGFFPRPGTLLPNGILCIRHDSSKGLMTLPDFLETRFVDSPTDDRIVASIRNPVVISYKIHLIQDRPGSFEDHRLEEALRRMYRRYLDTVEDEKIRLLEIFGDASWLPTYIVNSYFCCNDRIKNRHKLNLNKFAYLLEYTVASRLKVDVGDKFSNRYAAKGVVSLILPDSLRPVTESGEPIDYIYNPFGVFSRMNLGQVLEIICAKNVHAADRRIRNGEDPAQVIAELNDAIIQHLSPTYYAQVAELVEMLRQDPEFRSRFVNDVVSSNLFICAPYFTKIDVRKLVRGGLSPMEKVILPKKLLQYMKQKMKIDLAVHGDLIVRAFCGPQYLMRLNKLAGEIINSRDIGPIRSLSGQPVRGRAKKGGSVVGQMEIEALIAHGCENFLREIVTVKSDRNNEKEKLLESLIRNGTYTLTDIADQSRTRMAIEALMRFFNE